MVDKMHQDNQPTFFFFDYETWGSNPATDRPCQFAGVRTDRDFNIIGEPIVLIASHPMTISHHLKPRLLPVLHHKKHRLKV